MPPFTSPAHRNQSAYNRMLEPTNRRGNTKPYRFSVSFGALSPFGQNNNSYGNNPRITAGSSSIFIIAKSAEPASLSEAPMCQTVLSTIRKRSCDFL